MLWENKEKLRRKVEEMERNCRRARNAGIEKERTRVRLEEEVVQLQRKKPWIEMLLRELHQREEQLQNGAGGGGAAACIWR